MVCFIVVRVRDPPAALPRPADGQREEGMDEEVLWECERCTAGLLLLGLESLGALVSKQSQLCFLEDRIQVDMTVPLAFPVSEEF